MGEEKKLTYRGANHLRCTNFFLFVFLLIGLLTCAQGVAEWRSSLVRYVFRVRLGCLAADLIFYHVDDYIEEGGQILLNFAMSTG